MITFNSKFVTIAALGFIAYCVYLKQKDALPTNSAMRKAFNEATGVNNAKNAMYKIQVPKNKKYENYNPIEKFIYNFSKNEIDGQ